MKIQQLKRIIELCENSRITDLNLVSASEKGYTFYGERGFWGDSITLTIEKHQEKKELKIEDLIYPPLLKEIRRRDAEKSYENQIKIDSEEYFLHQRALARARVLVDEIVKNNYIKKEDLEDFIKNITPTYLYNKKDGEIISITESLISIRSIVDKFHLKNVTK